MSSSRVNATVVRRSLGALIAVFGLFVLFGGLFVPIRVILDDPSVVPAPESWVAVWLMLVGLVLLALPARRSEVRH